MTSQAVPAADRSTCSPYRAEDNIVIKTATKVQGYRTLVRVPAFRLCEVNEGLEDPAGAAVMIAQALNAHALIRATSTHQSKTALRYWLETYLASLSIPVQEPDRWLEEYQAARERAARLIARHGLIALIVETSRLLASQDPKRI